MSASDDAASVGQKVSLASAAMLFVVGLIWRGLPLLNISGRLLRQWPTEDGYFMLTMGRNVALGNGLSVAGGEIPTNGTQPLTTFIWALLFRLFGPEREAGVLAVLLCEALVALLTAWLIVSVSRKILVESAWRGPLSALTAGLWFVSPVGMPHGMNCLETGVYGLFVAAVARVFLEVMESKPTIRQTIGFGVLLGGAFWARNDATFLILAVCVLFAAPLASSQPAGQSALTRAEMIRLRLPTAVAFGAVSVVVASPWLLFNLTRFGHIMPVSGRAEALTREGTANLSGIPIVLAEYLGVLLPIPDAVSSQPLVVLGSGAAVVAALALSFMNLKEMASPKKRLVLLTLVYGAGLCVFYGFFFGAPWFLPRYFFPLSPLLSVLVITSAGEWLRKQTARPVMQGLALASAIGMLLAGSYVSLRQYHRGIHHPHFQVVEWVRSEVPARVWVGAIQTGTLGFFHDRTVNLDGKVNIHAYEALVQKREAEYVVKDTSIQYLVDWVGMKDWMNKPLVADNFELFESDSERNLEILRRRPGQDARERLD